MSYISLTPSTNALFAPSEKSIIVSQNKQEFKRKPLFHLLLLPVADSFIPEPPRSSTSINGPQKKAGQPHKLRHSWSSAVPPWGLCSTTGEATFRFSSLHGGWYPANDHIQQLPFWFLESMSGHPGRDRTQADMPFNHTLLKQLDKQWALASSSYY